jgi:hypothetical protein
MYMRTHCRLNRASGATLLLVLIMCEERDVSLLLTARFFTWGGPFCSASTSDVRSEDAVDFLAASWQMMAPASLYDSGPRRFSMLEPSRSSGFYRPDIMLTKCLCCLVVIKRKLKNSSSGMYLHESKPILISSYDQAPIVLVLQPHLYAPLSPLDMRLFGARVVASTPGRPLQDLRG